MHRKIITAGLTLVSFSMVGGMAYAATQSVSTRPSPQVVIPAAARSDDRTTATTVEDRVPGVPSTTGHDAGDDRTAPTTPSTMVTVTTVAGVDDRVSHDANDDRTAATSVPTTSVAGRSAPGTTVPDDRGRHAEPGDDRATSGSSEPSTPTTSPSSSNSGKGSNNSGSGSGTSGSSGSGGSGSGGSGRSGKDG